MSRSHKYLNNGSLILEFAALQPPSHHQLASFESQYLQIAFAYLYYILLEEYHFLQKQIPINCTIVTTNNKEFIV